MPNHYLYILLFVRMPGRFYTISTYFSLVFLSLLPGKYTVAQPEPLPVSIPLPQENFSLSGFSAYALADKGEERLPEIVPGPFYLLKDRDKADGWPLPERVQFVWIRFAIGNKLLRDTIVILKVEPYTDRIILYEQVNGGFTERGRSGRTLPVILLSIPEDEKRIRIHVKAGKTQVFLLGEQRSNGTGFSVPALQSEAQADLEQIQDARAVTFPRRYVFILLAGFHLSIFCFSCIKYYSQKKDSAYLFYSLSNGCTFFIYLLEAGALNLQSDHWNNLQIRTELSFVLNIISTLLYVAFQNELLHFKTSHPGLLKCIRVYAGFVLLGMVLTVIFNHLQLFPVIQKYSLLIFQTGQILGAGAVTYITRKQKGFYKYIFYGSINLLIGCCTFIFLQWWGLQVYLPSWFRTDIHIVLPAIAIDVLFFLIALVYRDKQVEIEKIRAEQQLVEQLKANKILQDDFTRNLEGIVKEKTAELIRQRAVLEEEKEAKLIAEYEQKFSASELKALRSQINPHFIFNVLNTIESYALQNNRQAVSAIIQKFSKLTRLVLENSLQLLVPVSQDLEALRLYTELEQMRYEERFEVRYDIAPAVLQNDYFIPPMVIQPYVENAILHGLRNLKSSDGLLQIAACRVDGYISITIEDNGIGRKKAATLKENNPIRRSSVGMKVTHDRITVLNSLMKGNKAKVEIEDLQRGTRIRLLFPLYSFP